MSFPTIDAYRNCASANSLKRQRAGRNRPALGLESAAPSLLPRRSGQPTHRVYRCPCGLIATGPAATAMTATAASVLILIAKTAVPAYDLPIHAGSAPGRVAWGRLNAKSAPWTTWTSGQITRIRACQCRRLPITGLYRDHVTDFAKPHPRRGRPGIRIGNSAHAIRFDRLLGDTHAGQNQHHPQHDHTQFAHRELPSNFVVLRSA
jgi:hypothetical protein